MFMHIIPNNTYNCDWFSLSFSSPSSETYKLAPLTTLLLNETLCIRGTAVTIVLVFDPWSSTSFIFFRDTWAAVIPPDVWVIASCIKGTCFTSLFISVRALCSCSCATSASGLNGKNVVWLKSCCSFNCLICRSSFLFWRSSTLHLVHSCAGRCTSCVCEVYHYLIWRSPKLTMLSISICTFMRRSGSERLRFELRW